MENKQTAVEWLIDWMIKNQYFIGNDLLKSFKQAKEMEKQQMFEYIKNNIVIGEKTLKFFQEEFEKYYTETFNKQ